MSSNHSADIKVFREGALGHLVMSNSGQLNALAAQHVVDLTQGLNEHIANPKVKAILISSDAGRAFCAGGQMKQLRDLAIDKRFDELDQFFKNEYALNLAIAQCEKPYIALIDGIAMGGGIGVSVHGSFRIVTQNAVLAMPETRIGFFPDVGASFFLPALPKRAGYWLGLTAATLNSWQSLTVGLATHYIESVNKPELSTALQQSLDTVSQNDLSAAHTAVTSALDRLGQLPEIELAEKHRQFVEKLDYRASWFADSDLQRIEQRLKNAIESKGADSAQVQDAQELLALLKAGSPYSMKITLELFDKASGQTLSDCLELERKLASEAYQHPDFIEGIRAVLVDKDRSPQWVQAES